MTTASIRYPLPTEALFNRVLASKSKTGLWNRLTKHVNVSQRSVDNSLALPELADLDKFFEEVEELSHQRNSKNHAVPTSTLQFSHTKFSNEFDSGLPTDLDFMNVPENNYRYNRFNDTLAPLT